MRRVGRFGWIIACGLGPTLPVGHAAEPLLREDFVNTARTTEALPESAAWFSGTESEHIFHDAKAGILQMKSAENSSRHVLGYFVEDGREPIELDVGESLLLKYTVFFEDPVHSVQSANSFRVGLFDSRSFLSGTPRITADAHGGVSGSSNDTFDQYVGYRFDTILHTRTSAAPLRAFRREEGSQGASLLTLTTAYSDALVKGGESIDFPEGLYRGEVEISRDSVTSLRFAFRIESMDDPSGIRLAVIGVDKADPVFRFDTVAFAINSRVAASFRLHDVTIDLVKDRGEAPFVFQAGSRTISTDHYAASGAPIVPMWKAARPTEDLRGAAGFPVLDEAEHSVVWRPGMRSEGAYNHYAALIHHDGWFYAMWGNHVAGEDAPGQRIMFSSSKDWREWPSPRELFEAPGRVKVHGESGIHLKPDRWVVVENNLYAVAYVHGAGRYPIAREVADGALGSPFLLGPLPPDGELPLFMKDVENATTVPPVAAEIREWYMENDAVSWWAASEGAPSVGIDGASLIESFAYRATGGEQVLMMRNWGTNSKPVHNNRLYVSFRDEQTGWSAPYPTDIPDAPSRGEATRLTDGTVILIGNQNAARFDQPVYLKRDPLTVSISDDGYTFSRVYALRTAAPSGYRFAGIGGRTLGFAYPSSIVHEGFLYSLYSIGKEEMALTRVALGDMELSEPTSESRIAAAEAFLGKSRTADGFIHASSMGTLWVPHFPWVYSYELHRLRLGTPEKSPGWLFAYGESFAESAWFYDNDLGVWWFTVESVFPWIYCDEEAGWILVRSLSQVEGTD